MKDVFGFAEHQDNCTYGLGYKLTLQRNSDNHILGHPAGANDAATLAIAGRIIIDDKTLYVPHYFTSISNQIFLLGHTISRAATELSYIKRSSFRQAATTATTETKLLSSV